MSNDQEFENWTAPPLPFTRLIHENLAVVMTFVYSYQTIQTLLEQFKGEWKYLRKTTDEIAPERAVRAVIELASLLRSLDDREGLSDYLRKTGSGSGALGRVVKHNAPDEPLFLRDLTNKILHASGFNWKFGNDPKLVCISGKPDRWKYAEIEIRALAAHCGMLMH